MSDAGHINLSLREHGIGFFLPPGGKLEGRMVLPHGALLSGEFVGELLCESGSIIIPAGAKVRGTLEADRIYVEGDVSSLGDSGKRSMLIARLMVAGSSTARINAELYSQVFSLHKSKIWGCLHAIEEVDPRRLLSHSIKVRSPQPKARPA
jgi:hypothetical protein